MKGEVSGTLTEALTPQTKADGDNNGVLDVFELASFVTTRVSDIAWESYGVEQVPQSNIYGHDYPFAILPGESLRSQ